jgi:hypothetical protein
MRLIVDAPGGGGIVPFIGRDQPLARSRLTATLPLPGARLLAPAVVVQSLGGPDGAAIGMPQIFVQRMVSAGRVTDTRRL